MICYNVKLYFFIVNYGSEVKDGEFIVVFVFFGV